MNSWKVIFATMVIFGTGVVTGGLLVRYADGVHAPQPAPGIASRPFPSPPAGVTRIDFLRRMERELNLTPEQRERADKILKESQERTKKLMEPIAPQLRHELQKTKEYFRSVLTPEQQARFDQLWRQQQRPRDPRRQLPLHERPPEAANSPPVTNLTIQ